MLNPLKRLLWPFIFISVLSACTVHLVPDYDDQIDNGLSQLNTDTTAFVNKMIKAYGTPDGKWEKNQDFYNSEDAKIDTLIARAEAHKVLGNCPTADAMASALSELSPGLLQQYPIPQNDECSVILLQEIKAAFVDLEAIHKVQGGIPASMHDLILVGGLGSLIHSAIVVEIAKKNIQTAASQGEK